jgi:UDP-glucose 4-epimerase
MNDLAKKIIRKTKSRSTLVHIPYDDVYEDGFEDMRRRVPDVSKLQKTIGFTPKLSTDQILDRILAYSKSEK